MQFIRAAESDTDGTLVGFPTAAFDWSSFNYYSTYVAFHNASGGNDTIYVRDESGNPLYSWTDSADPISGTDETIVGTPAWTTIGGIHYVYVAVNGARQQHGRRLPADRHDRELGLTLDTSWTTWAAPVAGVLLLHLHHHLGPARSTPTTSTGRRPTLPGQRLFGIKQLDGTASRRRAGRATVPATVTTSAPTLVTGDRRCSTWAPPRRWPSSI